MVTNFLVSSTEVIRWSQSYLPEAASNLHHTHLLKRTTSDGTAGQAKLGYALHLVNEGD